MAKRRVARRGRVQVAIYLGAFLLVAAGLVWRKSAGYARALELRALDRQRAELESERTKLVNELRTAVSFGRMGNVASSRLGMRMPSDSQIVPLPRPTPRSDAK